jgi:hypothetical protein
MVVMDTHFGVYDTPEQFVERIRDILSGDMETILAEAKPAEVAQWVEDELVPPLSEEDLLDLVQESMARAGYGTVGIHTVKLSSGDMTLRCLPSRPLHPYVQHQRKDRGF